MTSTSAVAEVVKTIPSIRYTPASGRNGLRASRSRRPPVTPEEISDLFNQWWAASYPNAHVTPQARATFTAFAAYVLEQLHDDTPTAA